MKILTLLFLIILNACTNQALTEAQRSLSQRNYDSAIKYLKLHLESHPKDAEAWYQLGYSYGEIQDYNRMSNSFLQSLKYNPDNKDKITDYKKRKFEKILETINDKNTIYKRLDNKESKEAQKLAIDIYKTIEIALTLFPNDKRIPDFEKPIFISDDISMSDEQLQKLKNSRLAMIDLTGNNLNDGTASAISNRLFHELFKTGFYVLLEREEIDEILREQAFQQSGCVSSECLVEIGRLLNVELMLGGTVSKIENFYMIDVRLIDVETGKILLTTNEDFTGDFESFIKIALPKIAGKLIYHGG